jgi:hypothetical protein
VNYSRIFCFSLETWNPTLVKSSGWLYWILRIFHWCWGFRSYNCFGGRNVAGGEVIFMSWEDKEYANLTLKSIWRQLYHCSPYLQGRIKLFGAPRQWHNFRPLFQAVFFSWVCVWGGYYLTVLAFSWQILFLLSYVYCYVYKRKKTKCKYLFN